VLFYSSLKESLHFKRKLILVKEKKREDITPEPGTGFRFQNPFSRIKREREGVLLINSLYMFTFHDKHQTTRETRNKPPSSNS